MNTTIPTVHTDDALDRPEWLPHERWPFTLRRYAHRSAGRDPQAIHYTDEGNGPVFVFVHAGMWSFIWRDVIAGLRKNFRCITLDFPGAGLSDGEPGDVDLPAFPSIVNGLLDHLDVESAAFVIHDLGGVVGVVAATERPHRIVGLAATNSFAWPPQGLALKTMFRIMGSRTASGLLGTFRVIPRLTRTSFGVGLNLDEGDRDAFFGPYRERTLSRNFHRAMRSARHSPALFDQAVAGLESGLAHLPVMTVFGEKNDPFGFADRWRTLFPDATSSTVPKGNHFPMCDDPTGYVRAIRAWHRAEVSRANT